MDERGNFDIHAKEVWERLLNSEMDAVELEKSDNERRSQVEPEGGVSDKNRFDSEFGDDEDLMDAVCQIEKNNPKLFSTGTCIEQDIICSNSNNSGDLASADNNITSDTSHRPNRRFPVVDEEELTAIEEGAASEGTKKQTKWGVKLYRELNKNPVEGFSAGLIDDNDIYRWEVVIIGLHDTYFEGCFFKAHLIFPKDYPLKPPKMVFKSEMWHPNIDKDGNVCISILHEPGDDKWGYEQAAERWLPVHTVESIILSVMSMLADPNDESPANVEAAKMWREDPEQFRKRVLQCVRKSQENL